MDIKIESPDAPNDVLRLMKVIIAQPVSPWDALSKLCSSADIVDWRLTDDLVPEDDPHVLARSQDDGLLWKITIEKKGDCLAKCLGVPKYYWSPFEIETLGFDGFAIQAEVNEIIKGVIEEKTSEDENDPRFVAEFEPRLKVILNEAVQILFDRERAEELLDESIEEDEEDE